MNGLGGNPAVLTEESAPPQALTGSVHVGDVVTEWSYEVTAYHKKPPHLAYAASDGRIHFLLQKDGDKWQPIEGLGLYAGPRPVHLLALGGPSVKQPSVNAPQFLAYAMSRHVHVMYWNAFDGQWDGDWTTSYVPSGSGNLLSGSVESLEWQRDRGRVADWSLLAQIDRKRFRVRAKRWYDFFGFSLHVQEEV